MCTPCHVTCTYVRLHSGLMLVPRNFTKIVTDALPRAAWSKGAQELPYLAAPTPGDGLRGLSPCAPSPPQPSPAGSRVALCGPLRGRAAPGRLPVCLPRLRAAPQAAGIRHNSRSSSVGPRQRQRQAGVAYMACCVAAWSPGLCAGVWSCSVACAARAPRPVASVAQSSNRGTRILLTPFSSASMRVAGRRRHPRW